MHAFDPLFRRRVPVYRRRSSVGGIIGLAGIGYMVYRWLQSPRGQEVQTQMVDRMKGASRKWNNQMQQARS